MLNRGGDLPECAPLASELVRDAHRRPGFHLARDEPAALEIFEARREHFGPEARRAFTELTETTRAGLQGGEYHRCPRTTEDLDGRLERLTLTIDRFCHVKKYSHVTF